MCEQGKSEARLFGREGVQGFRKMNATFRTIL